MVNKMEREVKIKGIYKHFKGDLYIVEDIAQDSNTLEKIVVYRGLYENSPLWTRPLDDFLGKVDKNKHPKANQEYKFELQIIESKRKS